MKNLNFCSALFMSLIIFFVFTSDAQTILRTFTYHQITDFTESHVAGQDWQHVLSDNGNKVVWYKQTNPKKVIVINSDGTGYNEVVDMGTERLSQVDISADGSKIVYVGGLFFSGHRANFVNADGSGDTPLIELNELRMHTLKIAGDGSKAFFNIYTDASIVGGGSIERGLYSINLDGTGLTQIAGPADVATSLGINSTDVGTFYGGSSGHSIDVSYDGTEIIFTAKSNADGKYYVFTANGGITKILGPFDYLNAVGISPDGTKVAACVNDGGNHEGWVSNYDGSSLQMIASNEDFYFSNGNGLGDQVSLTENGSQVIFDGYGHLFNTDGGGVIQLSANAVAPAGQPMIVGSLPRATMSSDGKRVLFSFYRAGFDNLAIMDIGPQSLGASPTLSNISTTPNSVSINPITGSDMKVMIAPASQSDSIWYVGVAIVKDGIMDTKFPGKVFYDDGVSAGDQVAGDNIWRHNNVTPYSDAVPGPRTLRFDAEVFDASGKLQGTAIDVEPFTVVPDTTYIGIEDINSNPDDGFTLYPNYPNPVLNGTMIAYHLTEPAHVKLNILNAVGELVTVLADQKKNRGNWNVYWDANGQEIASGIYFIQMQVDGINKTRKLLVTK